MNPGPAEYEAEVPTPVILTGFLRYKPEKQPMLFAHLPKLSQFVSFIFLGINEDFAYNKIITVLK